MAHLERLLGSELIAPDGVSVPVRTLEECELIGLYFSAQWCPPCKGFTPVLTKCYTKVKESGKRWEVVFVSLDTDQESCVQYFQEMPWLMLPYDSSLREPLPDQYGLLGIPAVVFIDPKTGEKITDEGRTIIISDQDAFHDVTFGRVVTASYGLVWSSCHIIIMPIYNFADQIKRSIVNDRLRYTSSKPQITLHVYLIYD
ncbi:hypothetical protein Btru_066247 [Bulinus truncatus]|nr:hypothetical protein Btru_066247 [Bulinus truncatus]